LRKHVTKNGITKVYKEEYLYKCDVCGREVWSEVTPYCIHDDSLSYKMSMQCEDEDHEEPGAIMISREIEL
jgi:DNA-directed RNA polymerase subunit RPC12/RpoP